MQPLLTSAETQAIDRRTIERGVPVEVLMERAGFAVAASAAAVMGGAYGCRVAVVCGKGNNAGDGLVAARHLARSGAAVDLLLVEGSTELSGPAASNLERIHGSAVRLVDPATAEAVERSLSRADLAVDALFGMGFRGSVDDPHASAIQAMNLSGVPVVAVDVPSGVEGDTGIVRGPAVTATVTVTFGAPKLGVVLYPGSSHAGELVVSDIGFPPDVLEAEIRMVDRDDVRALLPRRSPEDHKRRSGVVLVVGGSRGMTGAPALVARGAFRAGAGLVRVASPVGALPAIQAGLREATFTALEEEGGAVAEHAVGSLELSGVGAIALGPGLSTAAAAPRFVRRLVQASEVPTVVDADALNAFAGAMGDLAARKSEAVLTPHTGELARLFGVGPEEILEDRIGFARKAAAEARAVVLLKGPRTLVVSPDGEVRVNPTGSPALATGGTGDVLAGMVAAYLARGSLPLEAATAAAYVHGAAGEMLEEGSLASDVADAIPAATSRILG
ncbi:MAG TPA: NAD(P)H-hydrate dehydratase [Actinomycetota bacterium]|nr:NAD(P)H-hydrate dehydratase [Actinomycetota bacterium]